MGERARERGGVMSQEQATIEVVDNPAEGRFEAHVDGQLAIAEYLIRGSSVTFTHTLVPEALRRRGIGSALARAALEKARAEGWRVIPRCPFIAAYIAQHAEYQPLVKSPT